MEVRELSELECFDLLPQVRLVRLACCWADQPYVVPIHLAYHESFLYGFSLLGRKIEWMRSNPQVCVEWDRVINESDWTSLVILGSYEELPAGTRECQLAHDLLERQRQLWWQPAIESGRIHKPIPLTAIFYRIRIDRISGRHATP